MPVCGVRLLKWIRCDVATVLPVGLPHAVRGTRGGELIENLDDW